VNVLPDGTAGNAGTTASGLPIRVSDGAGVTAFDIELDYNPALLTISNVTTGSAVPGSWSLTFNNETATGQLFVSASSPDGSTLPSGVQTLVVLTASVPANSATTPYGASEALALKARLNEGAIPSIVDEAVHKLVFFGDTTGDGKVMALDASELSRIAVHLDGGFYADPLTDPTIIGDVTGDGTISALDASYVAQKAVGMTVPQIPTVAARPTVFGPDPTVQIGNLGTLAQPGDRVSTGVRVTDNAAGLTTADFTISYDTSRLDLSDADVTLSPYLAGKGWNMVENANDAAGTVSLLLWGATPLPAGTPDLVGLAFQVPANAPIGTSPLHITGLLNDGGLVMTPVDGTVVVAAPATASTMTTVAVAESMGGTTNSAVALGRLPVGAGAALQTGSLSPASVDQFLAEHDDYSVVPNVTQYIDTGSSGTSAPNARLLDSLVAAEPIAASDLDILLSPRLGSKLMNEIDDAALLQLLSEGNQ
jgi:hypothetical protein